MEKQTKVCSWFARVGTLGFFSLSIIAGLTVVGMALGKSVGSLYVGGIIGFGFGLSLWGVVITLKNWSNV